MNENEIDLLNQINDKLNKLVALYAIQGKTKDEQVKILAGLDFANSEISLLTGIPKGTVDVTRAKQSKKR